ncbi:MAG: DUF4838 domain-containing protein [Ignavibacteriaceae bacterium]
MKLLKLNIIVIIISLLLIKSNDIYAQNQTSYIVKNGEPKSEIIIGFQHSTINKFAAAELRKYIKKISGAKIPILFQETNKYRNKIYIGQTNELIKSGLINKVYHLKKNGFIIKSIGTSIFIAGPDSLGTLYGVYELLEMLGVRWYMPGPLGEVIPRRKDISFYAIDTTEQPDFTYRWVGQNDWSRRNKCNINIPIGKKIIGTKIWGKFSTFYNLLNPNVYFKDHPEYFSFYSGSRQKYNPRLGPKVGLDWNNQICTSNHEVIKQVATNLQKVLLKDPQIKMVTLGPNDGRGFCECPNCKLLDEKGDASDQIMSHRLLIFYNQVAKIIQKTNPGILVRFGAYFIYTRPPKDTNLKALDNMAVTITHYDEYCESHPIDDTLSIPNGNFRTLLNAWEKVVKHIFIYEYYYKVNWLELPWPIVHSISKDIPYLKRIGVDGFYTQYSNNNTFTLLLNYYIAAKLLWNSKTNVNALLNEFYNKFYGEAHTPMKKYYQTMEIAMANPNYDIPGYAPANATKVFTDSVLTVCENALNKAEILANDKVVKARITMAQRSFDYTKRCVRLLKMAQICSTKPELEKTLRYGQNLIKFLTLNKNRFKQIMDMSPLIGKDSPDYLGAVLTELKNKIKNIDINLPKK